MDLGSWRGKVPRWARHVLFWVGYVSFYTVLWGSHEDTYLRELGYMLGGLPVELLCTYVTLYLLLPYVFRQQYGRFFGLFAALLLVCGFLDWVVYLKVTYPALNDQVAMDPIWFPFKIIKFAVGLYPIVAIASVIKVVQHWYGHQQATQQLAKEKLAAELKYLKGQIHPHFLFNTLNNLYALTLKKSDNAPEMVLKLSDLLNYMLYECNDPFAPLDKELQQIENYLGLERLRYGDRLDVQYEAVGDLSGKRIAPMLMIAFVENAFKHGTSESLESVWVNIRVEVQGDALTLKVENSKAPTAGQPDDPNRYKEGIGLRNVQRRLELLYPEAHSLKIMDAGDSFLVVLTLNGISRS